MILLYARDGSSATCNLSAIDADRQETSQLDSTYFAEVFPRALHNLKIERHQFRNFGGQIYATLEGTFELQLPSSSVKTKTLIASTIRNHKRFMLVMNVPLQNFDDIYMEFDIIAGTLLFHQ